MAVVKAPRLEIASPTSLQDIHLSGTIFSTALVGLLRSLPQLTALMLQRTSSPAVPRGASAACIMQYPAVRSSSDHRMGSVWGVSNCYERDGGGEARCWYLSFLSSDVELKNTVDG
jgi:hypothetical protein